MARKSKSKGKRSGRLLPVLHPDAAGIDIGAEEIFVAVPPDRESRLYAVAHIRNIVNVSFVHQEESGSRRQPASQI